MAGSDHGIMFKQSYMLNSTVLGTSTGNLVLQLAAIFCKSESAIITWWKVKYFCDSHLLKNIFRPLSLLCRAQINWGILGLPFCLEWHSVAASKS